MQVVDLQITILLYFLRDGHSDIDIYLTAEIHKVREFLSGPLVSVRQLNTAEVIHRKLEWELAGTARGNQCFTASGCLVIVTSS